MERSLSYYITRYKIKIKRMIHSLRRRIKKNIPWNDFRRLEPVSFKFGFDRGTPIDRYYITDFLNKSKLDIQGCVLEIADPAYTKEFGGNRVTQSEVLHVVEGNPNATMVGDLSTGEGIPKNMFDCIILTQCLNVIYDTKTSIENCKKALKPNGVLLATFPGISQIARGDMNRWGDFWRFTDASTKRLFEEVFGSQNVDIHIYGNVLTACAFLHGLSWEELEKKELDYLDPDFQVLIAVRAKKAS